MLSIKNSVMGLSLVLAGALAASTIVQAIAADDSAKPAAAAKPAADAMSDDMPCCKASDAAGMACGICNPNAKAEVGKPAVNFLLKDADGKDRMLSDSKGKIIVLTWADKDCPIFAGVAASKTFDKLQSEFKDKGVEFVYIDSGAQASEANLKAIAKKDGMPKIENANLVMDPSGNVGHMYDAKTTPDCYVIDKTGKLVYAGAIDNAQEASSKPVNYVQQALSELVAGKPVSVSSSKPYGCGVHYAPADAKPAAKTADAAAIKPQG